MEIFSMTRRDLLLSGTVKETISRRCSTVNPNVAGGIGVRYAGGEELQRSVAASCPA